MIKPTILFVCGYSGCGKSTISKFLVKNYLKTFYFLDKDSLYVNLSGEFMSVINNNRYDRDSPLYKKHCRDFEYQGMIDSAKENAELNKNTLLCAPFGKEFSNLNNFLALRDEVMIYANPVFVWLEANTETVKQNIIKRGHSFDRYKLDHWDDYINSRKSIPLELKSYVKVIDNNAESIENICVIINELIKE